MRDTHDWISPALIRCLDTIGAQSGADSRTGRNLFSERAELPDHPGAYVLVLELCGSVSFELSKNQVTLGAGHYLYCGSARGPGGIAARLGRHLTDGQAKGKAAHWHIDHLTSVASQKSGLAVVGGTECDLVHALATHGATVPLPGFGSTDCRACPAHLLQWSGQT